MHSQEQGFTLIELVLVVALIGIFSVLALPRLSSNVVSYASQQAMEAGHSQVQMGLQDYAADQMALNAIESYPSLLENVDYADGTPASAASPLFSSVLTPGLSKQWFKVDDDCYAFDSNDNDAFDDGIDAEFQYSSATGDFLAIADCGA